MRKPSHSGNLLFFWFSQAVARSSLCYRLQAEMFWSRLVTEAGSFTITSYDFFSVSGFIEVINNAETLRKIQVGHGVTGAFKDKPLASWLLKHNATEEDYKKVRLTSSVSKNILIRFNFQAVENFTKSCAGYCVATYVLGACDRHSDNIMITHDGQWL